MLCTSTQVVYYQWAKMASANRMNHVAVLASLTGQTATNNLSVDRFKWIKTCGVWMVPVEMAESLHGTVVRVGAFVSCNPYR
jgi:hypothetical protein